jgi:hypothetical protein
MDTSPDGSGSGGGGQQTPGSQQNNSSHTSNTAYSPPNVQNTSQLHQQQPLPQEIPQQSQFYTNNNAANNPQFFNPNDPAFTTQNFDTSYLAAAANSFDISQQQNPQQPLDYTQSQIWEMSNGVGTGLTPGGPGSGADIMNMNDVDWNQMMEGLGDWNQQVLLGHEDGGVGGMEPMAEMGRS